MGRGSNAALELKHKETWKPTNQGLNTTLLRICSKADGAQKVALCLTTAGSEALDILKGFQIHLSVKAMNLNLETLGLTAPLQK